MAKLSRSQLKSLIKECVVEVLIEGLNPSAGEADQLSLNEMKTAPRPSRKKGPTSSPRPGLDNIKFNQRMTESINVCTTDPVLGNILADTESRGNKYSNSERG